MLGQQKVPVTISPENFTSLDTDLQSMNAHKKWMAVIRTYVYDYDDYFAVQLINSRFTGFFCIYVHSTTVPYI